MEKHKFNIFPDMNLEDYARLKNDIKTNGYDSKCPIYIYENEILDGWHRQRVCDELKIEPIFCEFDGTDIKAINFVLRSNKRRNLTSSQWAAIAVESTDIIESIKLMVEKERREKQANTQTLDNKKNLSGNLLPQTVNNEENKTATKIAEFFNTNKTYVKEAQNLKDEAPELFAQVKSGKKTITKIKKEEEIKKAKEKIKAEYEKTVNIPIIYNESCEKFLERYEDKSCDLLLTDPPYSTDIDNLSEFINSWLFIALNKVKEDGAAFVCIGAYPDEIKQYLNANIPVHLILKQILIWTYKNTLGKNPNTEYKQNYQIILFYVGKNFMKLNCSLTSEQWAVQEINAPDGRLGNRYYKWQKPDKLAERLIRHTTEKGDIILDPFAGSGTFIIASNKLGRIGYGCEIDNKIIKIANERGCKNK